MAARPVPAPAGDPRWRALRRRDARHAGRFVYAVRTTGVYCRPGCPSRAPRPENVRFFGTAPEAEAAGFRPCRRCRPQDAAPPADPALAKVAAACRVLDTAGDRPPTLTELARRVGWSPSHLQRVFTRVVGVSPRRYADARRQERLRRALRAGEPVTAALYEAGYGSGSRLYEGVGARLGMTPAVLRRGAPGVPVHYAVAKSRLGRLLVAVTPRGVCAVRLGARVRDLEAELARELPGAVRTRDADGLLAGALEAALAALEGEEAPSPALPLDVQATAFERRVYEAIRAIPRGGTSSYGELAARVGRPGAARAVGRACARNPVPLLVPCHRVVRADGEPGAYQLGAARKRALLAREAAKARGPDAAGAARRKRSSGAARAPR